MKKDAISFSDHTFGVLEINIGPKNNLILLNKFGLYLHSQNSFSLFYLLISIKVFFTDTHVVPKYSRRILVHWETLTYRTGKDCWETGTATGRGWVKGRTLSSALDSRPANVSPSGLPSRGESGADATGGGVEGGLGGHDRAVVVEKQGTQTDMLRRRGRGGGGWRRRRGIDY